MLDIHIVLLSLVICLQRYQGRAGPIYRAHYDRTTSSQHDESVIGITKHSLDSTLPSSRNFEVDTSTWSVPLPSYSEVKARNIYTSEPDNLLARQKLPPASQFAVDKGKKWTVSLEGNIRFVGGLADLSLQGDKCRSSKLGSRVIWNCGDMQCGPSLEICGFSMGPAFYGTTSVMAIDTGSTTQVQDNTFLTPWHEDLGPPEEFGSWTWGMDTSNIAALNDTHGIAYGRQSWRSTQFTEQIDQGNAVAIISLGDDKPLATRQGPLLTGPDKIALGLLAILRVEDYIYIYSIGGPTNLMIGRVLATESTIFNASSYEFLFYDPSSITETWIPHVVPDHTSYSYGARTSNPSGIFGCEVYGSVFYNTYLGQYILLCSMYMTYVNMYVSDTPWGPWSEEYSVTMAGMDGLEVGSYGAMAHPEFGDGETWWFSIGPNVGFQVFRVEFGY